MNYELVKKITQRNKRVEGSKKKARPYIVYLYLDPCLIIKKHNKYKNTIKITVEPHREQLFQVVLKQYFDCMPLVGVYPKDKKNFKEY